ARYGCLYHSHPLLLSILIQRAPPSTLFPYTTLFRGSVQQRIEVARRTPAGERSGALHRRLGAEDVADRQPLRAVDVHRVADRGNTATVAAGVGGDRQRREPQRRGRPDEREVGSRADRDEPAVDRARPVRGDDADGEFVVA